MGGQARRLLESVMIPSYDKALSHHHPFMVPGQTQLLD